MEDPADVAYRCFVRAAEQARKALEKFYQDPTKATRKSVISAKNRETDSLRQYIDIIYGRAAVRKMMVDAGRR